MKFSRLILFILVFASSLAQAELVFIVNNANTSMFDQTAVANIFLGKTKEFPAGGKAIPVMLDYANPEMDNFLSSKVGKNASQYRALWARLVFAGSAAPPQTFSTSQEIIDQVAKNPNLIGIVDASAVKGSVRTLVLR